MNIIEKELVCKDINTEIGKAVAGLKSPQEPDYIAALTTGFAANLSGILNRNIRGMTFKVAGCFIHQKPLAKFLNPPYLSSKKPEIGDLLIVFKRIQKGEKQYNALLLQAKKNDTPFSKTNIPASDHQLILYTKWPRFQYERANYLNGKKRSVQPKASTPGAQYLLIDEKPNCKCCCSYCHYCCHLCCKSSVLFYTAPSSTEIQASHCFAWALIDFFDFHTGKPFVPKHQGRIDDWSQMIWDLLYLSARSVFNRRKAGYNSRDRYAGDYINFLASIAGVGEDIILNVDDNMFNTDNDKSMDNNEENGISILIIEGKEDGEEENDYDDE